MNDTHIGKLNAMAIAIWLDAVNTYGNSPMKLFTKINMNNLIVITDDP